MDNKPHTGKDRPFILVGPDGRALHMEENYQDPSQWEALETEDAVMLVARPGTLLRKQGMLEKIAVYVDEHLTEKITLKAVAAHCGVSVSTVTQLFQKKTSITFHQYLTQRRMIAARHLIYAGTPLEEVGKHVGYADHSTFYRAFKQTFGVSPREFRRKIQNEK